jgi:hypothetical protein
MDSGKPDRPSLARRIPNGRRRNARSGHILCALEIVSRADLVQFDRFFPKDRRQPSTQLRLVEARSPVRAQLSDPMSAAWHLLTRKNGTTVDLPIGRYQRALFPDVYPGIDADYHMRDGNLEVDFRVRPGGRPEQIRLSTVRGSMLTEDAGTGDVMLSSGNYRYRLKKPSAYQWLGSRKVAVPITIALEGQQLTFHVAAYDRGRSLTIDPLIATYATYVGSNSDAMYDNVSSVAVDAQGNIYLGGLTQFTADDTSFPTTASSLEPPNPRSSGAACAFQCGYVVKLDPAHNVVYGALVFGETVQAVAVDSQGSAYATGTTLDGTDFPGTAGTFSNNPVGEAFVFKLTPDGSSFVYNALFVGEGGTGMAVDANSNAYIVGNVETAGLPTTPTAVKPNYQSTGNTPNEDGFLLKIDNGFHVGLRNLSRRIGR